MVDDLDNRTVIDFATNKLGDLCVDFLINSNCCVLNGRTSGQNDYTFIQTTGHSVVDYLITTHEGISKFTSMDIFPASDLPAKYNITPCGIGKPDHSLLLAQWSLPIIKQLPKGKPKVVTASWKKYDVNNIPENFMTSPNTLQAINDAIDMLKSSCDTQVELDNLYTNFTLILKSEMDEKLPSRTVNIMPSDYNSKHRKMCKPWWSDNLTILWNRQCLAERNWRKCKATGPIKSNLKSTFIQHRRIFDTNYQRARRNHWVSEQEKFSTLAKDNPQDYWKMFGQLGIASERKSSIDMAVRNSNGDIETDQDKVLDPWKTDYDKLYNDIDNNSFDDEFLQAAKEYLAQYDSLRSAEHSSNHSDNLELNSEITEEEVFKAISRAKLHKSTGIDNIHAEVIKNGLCVK